MNFLALVFNEKESQTPKQWIIGIALAMTVMGLWVVSLLTVGFNLALYILMILIVSALVFVLPTTGLPIIILATMWYERWFTLQPIVFGDQIYKLYPLDVVFIMAIFGFVFHQAFGRQKRRIKIDRMGLVLLIFFTLTFLYLMWAFISGQSDNALAISGTVRI